MNVNLAGTSFGGLTFKAGGYQFVGVDRKLYGRAKLDLLRIRVLHPN